ncbi:MAG TPA: transposase [Propionibacteriaceae bacterium]|nr:transposase [Propionibacteriaceae bacterium]
MEGSSGHGRHLAERLVTAGFDAGEVPPRRTVERRRARRAPKTDHDDGYAIARAVAGEPKLGPVKPGAGLGEAHDQLVIVRDRRDLLVQRRKTMLNHAEAALQAAPLSWTDTGRAGRKVLPRLRAVLNAGRYPATAAERELLELLGELHTDIAELDVRIRVLEKRLAALIAACGSTLLDEPGIGVVTAATLLAEVGDPARFRNESAFNRWWGGAPVAISSGEGDGEPLRHRLDLLGNRTINSVIYTISITQSRYHQPARDYLARKRSEGHSRKEARRAHKTLLGRRIIRRMWADRRRQLDQSHQKAA